MMQVVVREKRADPKCPSDSRTTSEMQKECRPRLILVGDREVQNLQSLIKASRDPNYPMCVGGFVVPGLESDLSLLELAPRLFPDPEGLLFPIISHDRPMEAEEAISGSSDFGYLNMRTGHEFSFMHCPFDASALKARGQAYRSEYCDTLRVIMRSLHPDFILLSNFKLILDVSFAEEFAGRIINIHPSVLPELKGWRSENRAANKNQSPLANGFTIHDVSSDLDGGATFFQQRIRIPDYDKELEAKLGTQQYNDWREEITRWGIIREQALWTPRVLELVCSKIPRKTVSELEAFTAEGRAEFVGSEEQLQSWQEDYAVWLKEGGEPSTTFDEWCNCTRKPYQRVLFYTGQEWQTIEEILDAPQFIDLPAHLAPRMIYSFEIPEKSLDAVAKLKYLLEEAAHGDWSLIDRDLVQPSQAGSICYVDCSVDLASVLNAKGIKYEQHPALVGVKTPRLTSIPVF